MHFLALWDVNPRGMDDSYECRKNKQIAWFEKCAIFLYKLLITFGKKTFNFICSERFSQNDSARATPH